MRGGKNSELASKIYQSGTGFTSATVSARVLLIHEIILPFFLNSTEKLKFILRITLAEMFF